MRLLLRCVVLASLVCLVTGSISASQTAAKPAVQGAPAAAGTYWSACQIQRLASGGSVVNGPFNTYLSEVFQHDLKTYETLRKTYGEFISSKYGRELDNPQCYSMRTEPEIRAIYKRWIDEANKVGKAVMTGWTTQTTATKSAAQVAPATDAAPATAKPTHWGACMIDRLPPGAKPVPGTPWPYTVYISDVFPFDPKTRDLVMTFDAFIDAKYGTERDNPLCNIRTSEAGVREMHKGWIDEANKNGKAIMTGWKYPGK